MLLIKKEFNAHFPPAPHNVVVVKKTWRKWVFAAGGTLLALLGLLLYHLPENEVYLKSSFDIQVISVKEPVIVSASGFEKPADTIYASFVWDFGDGTKDTTTSATARHQYREPGGYQLSLHLLPRKPDKHIHLPPKDTIQSVNVCKPAFTVESETGAKATLNQPVRFFVRYDSLYPPSGANTWKVNGKVTEQNQSSFTITFSRPGVQTITYTDASYTTGTACDSVAETTIDIQPASQSGVNILQRNDSASLHNYVNPWMIAVILSLVMLLSWIYLKARSRGMLVPENSDSILNKLKGRGPPYEIPFNDTTRLITDETLINPVAESWKQRFAGEGFTLDIRKTIANIPLSGGQIVPAWKRRTIAAEYLVLIDRTVRNNQQVKLASYLLQRFSRSEIYIREFYFSDLPDLYINSEFPQGLPISRLYDLYPDHVLLIFSDGKPLLRDFYPVTNKFLVKPLERWSRRAIITPIPFPDWGANEQALQENFLVLPSDLKGLMLIFTLTEAADIYDQRYNRGISDSYKAAGVNFTRIDDVKSYLREDPFLFQWLCASAIYPSVEWNVFLGIGDALRHQRYTNDLVSYSGLLKLVRISWMKDGIMPDWLRLELLKQLEPLNEKIARETTVALLEYVLKNLDGIKNQVVKRMQLQLITDKFLLYAHAPLNPAYQRFEEAYAQFKTLWQDKQVTMDPILQVYLQKDGGWNTLVGNRSLSDRSSASEAVDTFFNKETTAKLRNLSVTKIAASVLSTLLILLLIALSVWKSEIKGTKADKWLHIVKEDESMLVPFTIQFSVTGYPETAKLRADSVSIWLYLQQNDSVKVGVTDTVITRQLPYQWIREKKVRMKILNRRNSFKPGTIYLHKNNVTVKIIRDKNSCLFLSSFIDLQLQNDLRGQWVDGRDRKTPVMTYSRGRLNGDTVLLYLRCDQNSEKFKAITTNGRQFFTYYLSRIDSLGRLGYYKDPKSYTTQNEALSQQQNPALRLLVDPSAVVPEVAAQLPDFTQDNWRSGTGELIAIDLYYNALYYTTGNKKKYATYLLGKVTVKDGVYRVISSTGQKTYRVIFLKDLGPQAISVSLCTQTFSTAAEAAMVKPGSCGSFKRMTVYHGSAPANAIYVRPGGQGAISPKSERQIKDIYKPEMIYQTGTIDIYMNSMDSRDNGTDQKWIEALFFSHIGMDENDARHVSNFNFVMHPYFDGTPFDRSYIVYTKGISLPELYGKIGFEYNSLVLRTSSYPLLDKLAAEMKSTTALSVWLQGYMSSEGADEYNLRLSADMANSAKTYLVNSGVDPSRIMVKGYGEANPIASNNTEIGRIQNRRVEIHLKYNPLYQKPTTN
nr:OmpA family protein [Hufsiella ginkgonis]